MSKSGSDADADGARDFEKLYTDADVRYLACSRKLNIMKHVDYMHHQVAVYLNQKDKLSHALHCHF